MKAQKDASIDELVGNDTKKVSKNTAKKPKTVQFSTTVSIELFDKIEELENRGFDRTGLLTRFFERCTSDEEYLKDFVFPDSEQTEQEQITTKLITDGSKQETNLDI
ncbi:hypothetical protein WAF17_02585 [Bernardetia sp. ABR2-2B]|uniref:hypothetical protein n=1 Tax=Bernardetia sp. ABR2-2B TaxID=3127472 RepID=UPI0030D03D4A